MAIQVDTLHYRHLSNGQYFDDRNIKTEKKTLVTLGFTDDESME